MILRNHILRSGLIYTILTFINSLFTKFSVFILENEINEVLLSL